MAASSAHPPAGSQATASNAVLQRNFRALGRFDPALVERLSAAEPATLKWEASKAGPMVASVERGGRWVALASRYDPGREAVKLLGEMDRSAVACVAVLGVGVGHHVARAVVEAGTKDLVIAFEPDAGVLRAVLEMIDHTAWLGDPRLRLFVGDTETSTLTTRLQREGPILIQGTKVVVHPATRQRAGEAVAAFNQSLTETIAFCRTTIATSLVNSARTCRNLISNLPWYAAGATTDELHGAAAGRVAVCVAAGPSLVKNVDLLRDAAVRRRVVVISTQTTLRPLLDRGIKPDFVTALDYSPISSRFYEGLPPLHDVTLVAEAKAHNAILRGFPGPIRATPNELNDRVLGELARRSVPIAPGATVAHLSFYLAQHLGCDPIVMIGQDLGFSTGLYYAPGTAVHRVWSSELGPFNTLETMEWQRVVRMRGHLRRAEDQHGQPMFTDEQMATYLKQFERDFEAAPQRVIDATEGGLPKRHTQAMPLAEALERYAVDDVGPLPVPPPGLDGDRLALLGAKLRSRRDELDELRRLTARTLPLLADMRKHQRDPAKMKRLFEQLDAHQRRVHGDLRPAFDIAMQVNTLGVYRRYKVDRAMQHAAGDAFERQRRQLERDRDNLEWLEQACTEALGIFNDAIADLPEIIQRHGRLTAPHAAAA